MQIFGGEAVINLYPTHITKTFSKYALVAKIMISYQVAKSWIFMPQTKYKQDKGLTC